MSNKKTIDDYKVDCVIGEGSYSIVKKVESKDDNKVYAIKQVFKAQIIKEDKIHTVKREKEILNKLDSPSIITLYHTFHDSQSLYFVLEYCENGDLLSKIQEVGSFSYSSAKHIAGEILLMLKELRINGIAHRDLKPENILLKENHHLVLTDFGTSIDIGTDTKKRSNSFVGTAEYISPELLSDKNTGLCCDLWAFGCILYQLLIGKPPFGAFPGMENSEWLTFQRIKQHILVYPENEFYPEAKNLIDSLLEPDPEKRLGYNEIELESIFGHEFFQGVDFDSLLEEPCDFESSNNEWEFDNNKFELDLDKYEIKSNNNEEDTSSYSNSIWQQFLLPNSAEKIVKMGLISKKKGLFSKKRQLILTDLPRLIYIDPNIMTQKGEIEWSTNLYPIIKDERFFYIQTTKRRYNIEDLDKNSSSWVEAINSMRNKYSKNNN